MVPRRDFVVQVGNSGVAENPDGIVLVLKAGTPPVPVDLTGSEIIFRATMGEKIIRKSSATNAISVDALAGRRHRASVPT